MRIDGFWSTESGLWPHFLGRGELGRRNNRSTFFKMSLLLILTLGLFWPPKALASGNETKPEQKNVLRATLDNGLRVVIVKNPLAPVVTTVVNYLVGSDEAPKGFPGMAHAQEHMMFRGSPGLSADQLANITASMGGMFDASTTQHVTQYYFVVPAEDLDVALHVESIRMRGALDTEKLWARERGAIEQEVAQDLSNPEYVFYTKLLEVLFKGTPYEHDALGTQSSFNKTTGAMLKKFFDTWYVPNNAVLVIVGNVQPEEVLSEVQRLFADIPAKKLPARPEVHLEPVTAQTMRLNTDKSFGLVISAFRMPGYDSPDYAAAQVLEDVLDSRRGSLYALVPEGKALETDFQVSTLPKSGLGYALAAFPVGADTEALTSELRKVLESVVADGVPADLVEAAKRHSITDIELEKNSVSGLAMAWSKALAVEGRQSPEDYVSAIKQVTVEDVNRVAKKYLDLAHSVTAILTPKPSGKPVSAKGFGGRESFTPKEVKHVKLPEWAEKSLERLSVPTSTLSPVVTVLPNGLKLIVQPETVSNTITVYGHVKNKPEMEMPAGQDGVQDVLDKLFAFGTTSMDRLTFLKALDDIGAYESAGTTFSLQVLSDRLDRGVQLLADNELHPALPPEAFATIRQQEAATVAGLLESPDYLAKRALKKAIYPKDDPSLRQATPATISSLTLDDVKNYYGKVFRPDLTTIVVIGDVTPDRAKEVVEKYFGGWKNPEGPRPETILPPVPPNGPATTAVPNSSRVQDKVYLAESTGLKRSDPDYYALELGNHVLGGAFYATRLYKDLREKAGLVYFVESSFDVSQTRGVYIVEYACNPPNVLKARSIVERNLKEMQSTPVSDSELQRAKALLLREIPLSESSINSIAMGFIRRTQLDLPLDEPILAAHRYVALDAEQVKAAFKKWIRLGDLVQVTEGPTPK
jgi:zinc protease